MSLAINCVQCGISFAKRPTGPTPRYCSAICRARACDERARRDGRLQLWQQAAAERRRKPKVTRTCAVCGLDFASVRTDRAHCGADSCRARWRSKLVAPYVHARRAARAGADAELFDNVEIFERDEWRCWLCGGATVPHARGHDPLRPSLDHVVPLARGGTHTRANVRCAHLRCNLKKGARLISRPALPATR